jgi:hypothetical protein
MEQNILCHLAAPNRHTNPGNMHRNRRNIRRVVSLDHIDLYRGCEFEFEIEFLI